MVNFPPLCPSCLWLAGYLHAKTKDLTETDAFEAANYSLKSPRDFARFNLLDAKGGVVTLIAAVEGGGRQLRNPDKVKGLRLSEHGDWRRNHLKTIEACLGKKPYFPYIYPDLAEVYLNKDLQTLRDLNIAIFRKLFAFIEGEMEGYIFRDFYNLPVLIERGKEIAERFSPEISSLETIATFGKESLLGFLAYEM